MQEQFSFSVPTSQLPLAFQQAELALSRAVKLAEQCRSLFERQPLLTHISVAGAATPAAGTAAAAEGVGGDVAQQAWLRLTLIAVVQQLKVDVMLGLGGLLAGNSAAGEPRHIKHAKKACKHALRDKTVVASSDSFQALLTCSGGLHLFC
jgi:hypothetical protein